MSIFQAKGSSKGTNRKAPCGNVPGTEISAKQFFTALGRMTPADQEIGEVGLVKLAQAVGLCLIKEKTHLCSKGEVKLSSAKGWYRWGHPGFPDEVAGKPKSDTYCTLPKVLMDKIKPILK